MLNLSFYVQWNVVLLNLCDCVCNSVHGSVALLVTGSTPAYIPAQVNVYSVHIEAKRAL